MEFKAFFETKNDYLQKIATTIGKEYQSSQEGLDNVFDRYSNGLTEPEKDELYNLIVGMIRAGSFKLRPGNYTHGLQTYAPPISSTPLQFSSEEQRVLQIIEPRVQKKFIPWLKKLYENDLHNLSEAERLDALRKFLEETYSIGVRDDGLITFYTLGRAEEQIIGNLPVAVYHHTTTALDRVIKKHGLQGYGFPGVKMGNSYKNSGAGVYVTTETSGPAVSQYFSKSIANHGGRERTWIIRTTLAKLATDPDDADINPGRHQFVLPYVSPQNLVEHD